MSRLPRIAADGRGRQIAKVAVAALAQAVAAGVAAFATRDVFAALAGRESGFPSLALLFILLASLMLATSRVFERIIAESVGQHYASALRVRLFKHLTGMSARDVASRRSGAMAMRFVGDLTAVRGWISLGIARLISATVVLPVSAFVLYLLSPALAAAAAVPVALGLGVMFGLGPRLGPAHKRLRQRRARLAANMSERIPHAPELRLLGRVATEEKQLLRATARMVESALERARGAGVLRAIPDAISGLAAASVLLVALLTATPAPEVAGALAVLGLIVQPMRDLAGVWDRHRAWVAARDKCEATLASPALERPTLDEKASERIETDEPLPLVFAGATSGLLERFSAVVPAGAKVAVVGPNGAGKSTLLALAAGLEAPQSGDVLFGAAPVRSLKARQRREAVALVGTRSPILAGSLRRALSMGVQGTVADADIDAVAREFGLGRVIDRLGGLQGRVSEAGRNLSAGQARRILLARAALSRPRLLLLDEPDDALDRDGPRLVEQLVRGCEATTVVVTHNPAVALRMDVVWYVEDGRLVELGPPQEVFRAGGPAAALVRPYAAA